MTVQISSVYNHHTIEPTRNTKPGLTQQHFASEVDINEIMRRASASQGMVPQLTPGMRQAMYGDFSNIGSYQEACNKVLAVEEAFNTLPAKVRERFKNNPQELIYFVENEKNRAEAIELGLIEQPEAASGVVPPPPVSAPQTSTQGA